MNNRSKLIRQIIVVTAVPALTWIIILLGSNYQIPALAAAQDTGSKIVEKAKQGHFDDAVNIGLQALHNDPSDELIYEQIADVYLIRAGKEPNHKEEWLSKAVFYTEKALSLNSKERDIAGVHLFQEARSYEVAGDLSAEKRCAYYDQATKLLQDRVSLLHGDQIIVDGRAFKLAPLRLENDKKLEELRGKSTRAGCK